MALIGAGLFVRSMQAAQLMDLGFDSADIGFGFLNPGAAALRPGSRSPVLSRRDRGRRDRCPASRRPRWRRRRRCKAGCCPPSFARRGAGRQRARIARHLQRRQPGSSRRYGIALAGRDFGPRDRRRPARVAIVNENVRERLCRHRGGDRQALRLQAGVCRAIRDRRRRAGREVLPPAQRESALRSMSRGRSFAMPAARGRRWSG